MTPAGAGDIDYRMFQTLVFGTDLIADGEVLAGTRSWPRPMRMRCGGARSVRVVGRSGSVRP